jgi:hypothetical protein
MLTTLILTITLLVIWQAYQEKSTQQSAPNHSTAPSHLSLSDPSEHGSWVAASEFTSDELAYLKNAPPYLTHGAPYPYNEDQRLDYLMTLGCMDQVSRDGSCLINGVYDGCDVKQGYV